MEQSLLVGFDLCNDYSQISYYNEKTSNVDSIYTDGDTDKYLIPTIIGVKNDTKEWLFGEEAKLCGQMKSGIVIENFLDSIKNQEKFMIFNVEFEGKVLLSKFFRKTLNLLKIFYPNRSIGKLVVTIEEFNKTVVDTIYDALATLGIGKDRVSIQSHKQSFIYYALSQKKELWMNDIGLFDFNGKGLYYHKLSIDRRHTPMVVRIDTKDFSQSLRYDMLENEKDNVSYIFDSLAKSATYKQIISTLYLTGKGFEGSWAEEVYSQLAIGRRLFIGRQLYTQGACFKANEQGIGQLEDFIFLSDEMISSTITMNVYSNAKVEALQLAKAGTPWYEVNFKMDIIPDNEKALHFIVDNVIEREKNRHIVTLEGLPGRPNKTTRLTVNVRFIDEITCVISLKDKGFGEFYPTSNRVWEKKIVL